MNNPWDTLADMFTSTSENEKIEGETVDNVLIAWPSLLRGIEQTFGQSAQLKVLDFGCGSGLFCNQLAGMGHEVTGYDQSVAMLAAARVTALPSVTIAESRSEALQPVTYDVITSCMVLPFIEDLSAIAAAFTAALNPQGLIIYATFNPAFITENADHPFFPPVEAAKTQKLELKPGVRIPFYDRSAADYQQIFESIGYKEVYREQPAFTPEFLARYSMPFPTTEPEFLVQGFRKK